ncbi:hypothetical protein BJV82DRAFT_709567 [Fennellomyces sp. T-0311]|nr:hypothetical protein BJV82DRAFT_709567 [Fennellomyces sp. T-0311]
MRFQFFLPAALAFAAVTVYACSEKEEDPTELILSDFLHYTPENCTENCPLGYARHGHDNCEKEYIPCHTFTCYRLASSGHKHNLEA